MSRNGETVKNAPLIERLKPCPFCGYEWPTLRQDHGKYWGVTCEKCGLYVMIHPSGTAEIKERMIDKWNRRTARDMFSPLVEPLTVIDFSVKGKN